MDLRRVRIYQKEVVTMTDFSNFKRKKCFHLNSHSRLQNVRFDQGYRVAGDRPKGIKILLHTSL